VREGLASVVELLGAVGERLAAIEKASRQSPHALKAQAEAVSEAVTDAVKTHVASMMEHVATLDRRLVGLASAEQVAAALQSDRDLMEKNFASHGETLQTLSGSAGAIYVRVRAMEHAVEDMRKASTEETERYDGILRAIEDLARIEERLSSRIEQLEARVAGADRERDRQFLTLLSELAEMVSRGDRGKFAERLRLFERKQEDEH
jgi:hypothetical protein